MSLRASTPQTPLRFSFNRLFSSANARHTSPSFSCTCLPRSIDRRTLTVRMNSLMEPQVATSTGNTSTHISPPLHPTYNIKHVIQEALLEDSGIEGDITSIATIPENVQAEAQFLAKDSGVVAGIEMANMIFNEVDCSLKVKWYVQDGHPLRKGALFGSVSGSARSILRAERVVLNFMQRMSGIATLTKVRGSCASTQMAFIV